MKKLLLLILSTWIISTFQINAQNVRTKDGELFVEERIEAPLEKMEKSNVEIIKVKIMKKWKALGLSSDMKSKMNHHVIQVRYIVDNTLKTIIIDVNLVPIEYDYAVRY